MQGFKYKGICYTSVLCITFNSIICINRYALNDCWHNEYQITMNMLGKVACKHRGEQGYSFTHSSLQH
jgi:hypothetical protein